MDYSLQYLNKSANFKKLTVENFVEKLNLIGLEVDNISKEKITSNLFLDNLRLLLKIPANREDLLNEKFFLKEISTIFLVEIYELWENLKPNYSFILQQKYKQYDHVSTINIFSETNDVLTYVIEIENANVKNSPLWLVNKLLNFGIQPYNNVRDILNLVFFEWGQNVNFLPISEITEKNLMYEFQIACLTTTELYFDEKNQEISLYPGTIVLKEKISNKIISVLGIIHSTFQITETEKEKKQEKQLNSFFLHATFYDIHSNPLFLNTLNTKISLKYLRRACLQNFKFSFQRILTLLELLTSCQISSKKYSTVNKNFDLTNTKTLCLQKVNLINFLNIKIPDPLIFQKAGLKIVCETADEYYFKIPTYRHDLVREIDIIEEYSRFIGYKNFDEIIPQKTVRYTKKLVQQKYFIKNFFLKNGFYEIITNPIADFENQKNSSVVINNPLNNEFSTLRRSLLSKLVETFELNSRLPYPRTDFFEIGRTFKIVENKIVEQDKIGGIFQLPILFGIKNSPSDWFVAKGFIENFLLNFGYKNFQIETLGVANKFFHPTRSIFFRDNKKILGVFGEINPVLRKEKYSHVRRPIYLFELNLNYLKEWKLTTKVNIIQEYSKYPLIVKDLSILVNKTIDFNQLKTFINLKSSYLKKVTIFDIYFDEKALEKVNLGIRLEFQSKTETLTNEFIENEIENIKHFIEEEFKIESNSSKV